MTERRELSNDEAELLRDEPLPPAEHENVIEDDEWAEFRNLSETEKKWALLQLQLDREQKYFDSLGMTD
ncbi:MAG: flagellar assembly protein FliH [Pyramidobacter sp.]|nr:flagellar assembly protein FliH [Pyramidobacter sp.]